MTEARKRIALVQIQKLEKKLLEAQIKNLDPAIIRALETALEKLKKGWKI